MIKKNIKRITHPFLKYVFEYYHSKPRVYRYKNVNVIIEPEVFSPYFTLSTKLLLNFIEKKDLKNKRLLELGCGSGIISIYSSSLGAIVTASDINPVALKALEKAAKANKQNIKIIKSNLFEDIPPDSFDYIIINPPYYPKNPINMKESAWFCGENFEYFDHLFKQLEPFITATIIMILSSDCAILQIENIAKKYSLKFKKIVTKKHFLETNYIFKIEKITPNL